MNTNFLKLLLIALCISTLVACNKKAESVNDDNQTPSTFVEDLPDEYKAKTDQNDTEQRYAEIDRICAAKAKPLCTYSLDGLNGDACVEALWRPYCINMFIDMGIGNGNETKIDLAKTEELLDQFIKQGLVSEDARVLVNLVKSKPNVCRNHTASQQDFDDFLARTRLQIKTMKEVNIARGNCAKEYLLREK